MNPASDADQGRHEERDLREVVGLFADRDAFDAVIQDLIDHGFDRTDLSVLGSHQSIDAAGKPGKPWKDAVAALAGELKYEVPLVASGAILLAGGAIAATVAGIVGASVGGAAIKEIIDEVMAAPHTDAFARALEAESIILWIMVADGDHEQQAMAILNAHGGRNVHVHCLGGGRR